MRIDVGLLVLRVGISLAMLSHGIPKLMKLTEYPPQFADPLGVGVIPSLLLAIFAEAVCSVLVALGLWTRLAAIPLLITMLVAAGIVHAQDPWGTKEKAVLYAIVYVTLVFTGGGKHSLSQKWN